jgi:hypothetical protein
MRIYLLAILLASVCVRADIQQLKQWTNHNGDICKIAVEGRILNRLAPGWDGVGEPTISTGEALRLAKEYITKKSGNSQVLPASIKYYSYRNLGMRSNIWIHEVHLVVFKDSKPIDKYLVVLPNEDVVNGECIKTS